MLRSQPSALLFLMSNIFGGYIGQQVHFVDESINIRKLLIRRIDGRQFTQITYSLVLSSILTPMRRNHTRRKRVSGFNKKHRERIEIIFLGFKFKCCNPTFQTIIILLITFIFWLTLIRIIGIRLHL